MTQTNTMTAEGENLFAPSLYARLSKVAESLTGSAKDEVLEIAHELRIKSMAEWEMDSYRSGDISRETLVKRLEELANGDAVLLSWFRNQPPFAYAWHDDTTEFFEGGIL